MPKIKILVGKNSNFPLDIFLEMKEYDKSISYKKQNELINEEELNLFFENKPANPKGDWYASSITAEGNLIKGKVAEKDFWLEIETKSNSNITQEALETRFAKFGPISH